MSEHLKSTQAILNRFSKTVEGIKTEKLKNGSIMEQSKIKTGRKNKRDVTDKIASVSGVGSDSVLDSNDLDWS